MPTRASTGKVKKSVNDQVAKSYVARRLLSQCGDSLDPQEEVLEELFQFNDFSYTATAKVTPLAPWLRHVQQNGRQSK